MILCIETATSVCSVSLCHENNILGLRESRIDKSHASLLTVFIEELLSEQKISAKDLDAVAVSKGPGSYTGLRIGVSTAKGICYGAGLPLIAVSTLKSMYHGIIEKYHDYPGINNTLFCPMIDARRMEVYSSVFRHNGEALRAVIAEIINNDSFSDLLSDSPVVFFGNGAEKCKDLISHPNAIFKDAYELSAVSLALPAQKALENKEFEDVAYFEPYYLKDFVATIPRKNILGTKG
jgi:tRNA threonylcarbamoyladenosine biosynthesis protein TsaB